MAFKTKRLLKKIVSWSGLFFFVVAAYMIYHQLSKYKLEDIKDALVSIPAHNLFLACMASLGGYVALSSYDFLALKYIGRKLAPWKWIFAGFIGFSISNNAGHAIVSGGAIRYRLYTRWRFHASEIVRMVTFSGFTYLVACFFLIILGYFLTPDHAFGEGSVSHLTTLTVTVISALGLLIYFGASLFYKKPIIIKDVEFDIPSFKMAVPTFCSPLWCCTTRSRLSWTFRLTSLSAFSSSRRFSACSVRFRAVWAFSKVCSCTLSRATITRR